jgi:hypothetical protein
MRHDTHPAERRSALDKARDVGVGELKAAMQMAALSDRLVNRAQNGTVRGVWSRNDAWRRGFLRNWR